MDKKLNILFLDDNDIMRDTFCFLSERLNYSFSIDVCKCPTEAFSKVANFDYDCIVTDFRMPKLNGKQFINAIYSIEKPLPGIIGYTAERNPKLAFGTHPLIKKVFDKNMMHECLEYIHKNFKPRNIR